MDWLKNILGEAHTPELEKAISEEVGKQFVLRSDFNALKEAKKQLEESVKTRDEQLETLKKAKGDTDELKKQIEELQATNKAIAEKHAEEIKTARIEAAVELEFSTAKVKNAKAVKALIDFDKVKVAEDGTVKGLTEQVKALQGAEDSKFMFAETTQAPPTVKGAKPAESRDGNPAGSTIDVTKMSYTEAAEYFEANPNAQQTTNLFV